MNTNTVQPKPESKHETASCCGGKEKQVEKPLQHAKPQDTMTEAKSSCCCK